MTRSGAFARVMGLTKSFPVLAFERGGRAASADHSDGVVAAAAADALAQPAEVPVAIAAETTPVDAATAPVEAAVAQVTVVEPDATVVPPDVPVAAPNLDAADADTASVLLLAAPMEADKPAVDPTDEIEADMATLLATLDKAGDVWADATDDRWLSTPASETGSDEDEPTLALLGELNRLWLADIASNVVQLR